MIFNSSEIDIVSKRMNGDSVLYFTFKGKFTEQASKASTQAWSNELNANKNQQYTFVWDCMDMAGFEYAARTEWLNCMQQHKSRIDHVVMLSGNIVIRGAAKVLLGMLGLSCNILKTREALKELFQEV